MLYYCSFPRPPTWTEDEEQSNLVAARLARRFIEKTNWRRRRLWYIIAIWSMMRWVVRERRLGGGEWWRGNPPLAIYFRIIVLLHQGRKSWELNISPWNSCVLLPISHCFYIYYYVSLLHARTYPYLRGISMALRHFNFTTRALKEQRCTWGDRLPANLTRINDFLRWEGKSQVNYHFIISKRTERWKIRVNFDRGWRWMRTEFL